MDKFQDTRSSLLLRVKNKASDEHAWQQFAELYQPVIMRMAKAKGMQEADAQDLAQLKVNFHSDQDLTLAMQDLLDMDTTNL